MNPGIFGLVSTVVDKLFSSPAERAEAKLKLIELERDGELREMQVGLSAIIAEAQSPDPYTSRARPSFLYVFYALIIALVILAPFVGVFFPTQMEQFFINVKKGFDAIPEAMWWTFTTGYLGYTAARQYGKTQGTDR